MTDGSPQRGCLRCHGRAPWQDEVPGSAWTVALVGLPNVGKTSLFNALTGQFQHTGNWPGKTVMYHVGRVEGPQGAVFVVDLPGLYSLDPLSPEERLTQDQLTFYPFDAVVHVVDASHLARDLYLMAQLLELGLPMLVALNMWDVASREGIHIHLERFSRLLGVPVIPTVARKEEGVASLRDALLTRLPGLQPGRPPRYPQRIEEAVGYIQTLLAPYLEEWPDSRLRGLSLRLLEGHLHLLEAMLPHPEARVLTDQVAALREEYTSSWEEDPALVVADARYGWAEGLLRSVVTYHQRQRFRLTRAVDRFVTHKWLGIPFFFLVMFLVFHLVINVTDPLMAWLEAVIQGPVRHLLLDILHRVRAPWWLRSLLVNGVLAGAGSMLTFLPGLTLLYFFLAWLEDSGYMARVAFVMDRVMQVVGLHGKAVLPLILGLGCNVPAIYATRTLERGRDRLITALVLPFVSCSARLPIYLIFGLAFFGTRTAWVLWGLYMLGFTVALVSAALLHRFLPSGLSEGPFLLELPPYHWPNWRVIRRQVARQVHEFVVRAGTVIVLVSVLLWFLMNMPWGVSHPRESWLGQVSAGVARVLHPLGFGRWEAGGALLSGMIAKEMVVSTMAQIYLGGAERDSRLTLTPPSPEDWRADIRVLTTGLWEALGEALHNLIGLRPVVFQVRADAGMRLVTVLRARFTPAGALAFMVFALLYVPCMATLAALYQEFGLRWAAFALVYQVSVAWMSAWVVYQVARVVWG